MFQYFLKVRLSSSLSLSLLPASFDR